ncbi:MAG TPA: asparagine--tRNA ligase [Tissierellaceae bacterium]|nr:asparagine--tRNA ligase [Tissierellaceae bacterium]
MTTTVKSIYRDTDNYIDKEIILEGWIRNIRSTKNVGFIELNDGTFFNSVQIVFSKDIENFKEIKKLSLSTSIKIKGILVSTPDAKQDFEVQAKEIKVEGYSSSDYPLQNKRHTFEYLRSIAHLRPRSNTFNAVFRVRSILSFAIHKFFYERDFVYVHTPIITSSDAEGAGEMFNVSTLDYKKIPLNEDGEVDFTKDFFNKSTFLTVSGQLEAEAYALAFKDVYTFGPTFRSENSNTSRHAAEFWMMEPEIAFADLKDNMDLAEDMMKYIISYVLDEAKEEMEFFNRFIDKGLMKRLKNIVDSDFERITYTKAIEILKDSNKEFEYPVEWGIDLQTEHERYISEEVYKKPVFVTDYPKEIKAFYMRLNDDNKTVAAMDLLVPGIGEIVGGSQREERLDILEQRILDNSMDKEDYWWYLELRKYGGTKHAGFGLGFERALMYITGMTNIRDVIPFPRTVGSAEF